LEIFSGWYGEVPPFAPWREAQKSDLRKLSAYYFKTNLPAGSGVSNREWKSVSDGQIAETLLVALEQYRPMLEDVRQFSDRPRCWFPQRQWLSDLMDSPSSRAMRGLLRLVRLRASVELAANRPAAAFDDLKFGLRLAHLGRQGPQPNSSIHTKHHKFVMDALQPLWEGLAEHRWTAEQVAEMQGQLEKLDFIADYTNAVRADALSTATLAERLIPTMSSKLPKEKELFYRVEEQRILNFVRLIYPRGWSLQDQAALHSFHLEFTSGYLDLPGRRIAEKQSETWQAAGLFSSSDLCFYIYLVRGW